MVEADPSRPEWQVRAEERDARRQRRESLYRWGLVILALGVVIVVYEALGLVYR